MRLYRKILAASVDTQNLGCHTTKDFSVLQRYNPSSNAYNYARAEDEQDFVVWISAKAEHINSEATAESNRGYPHEKEVVLLPNQIVKIEVYSKGQLIYKGTANTGTRFDKWVSDYI